MSNQPWRQLALSTTITVIITSIITTILAQMVWTLQYAKTSEEKNGIRNLRFSQKYLGP